MSLGSTFLGTPPEILLSCLQQVFLGRTITNKDEALPLCWPRSEVTRLEFVAIVAVMNCRVGPTMQTSQLLVLSKCYESPY